MNKRQIENVTVMVNDYDEAIKYYREKMGFRLVEDTPIGGVKRFVRMSPSERGPCILLATPGKPQQKEFVGNQTGGGVFLFLHTDNFWRDYENLKAQGVEMTEEPRHEVYGTVVVFRDLYGNLWDLVQPPADLSKIEGSDVAVLPRLELMSEKYVVHRLAAGCAVPEEVFAGDFFSVTATAEELSIVCSEKIAIKSDSTEPDWRCIKVVGPLEFSMTGVLARLSQALADANVSIFAISTFDTDYLLVKSDKLGEAIEALVGSSYEFIS
ncbi:ACT domain-containing protein [Pseudomonadales bacterium]|jgi:uncharacterized glyoxalase superfamily protein PhnB|nr:ACT domain-containing protein [Pseudomonadales bacterium]MDC1017329.1 ACT domain-containing protein [Pseudomonadales bacterium]|tara:strand:- start:3189 stop:3992 length:804 start_codon:yes stop_codon:yes gene_type:complete